jgi:nicotinate-nucleotide adenylyltransferase
MNIALLGGTFDPIHRGHLALARAAQERFGLGRIYFVPASVPPHKQRQPTTPFAHRYAMLVLATLEEKNFVPSLLEAPPEFAGDPGPAPQERSPKKHDARARATSHSAPSYTIETVRRFKRTLKKGDRLFFLIGIDAFLDIAKWREPEALLEECEFVVASRPGYSLADVGAALPKSLQASPAVSRAFRNQRAKGQLALRGAVVHLLDGMYQPVSSTDIRKAAAQGRPTTRWVGAAVAHYIKKLHLYSPNARENAIREVPAPE